MDGVLWWEADCRAFKLCSIITVERETKSKKSMLRNYNLPSTLVIHHVFLRVLSSPNQGQTSNFAGAITELVVVKVWLFVNIEYEV